MFIWMIWALAMTAIIVSGLIIFGNSIFLVILLAVFVIVILLQIYMYFGLPKIRYKSVDKFVNLQNNFIFTEKNMIVSSDMGDYSGTTNIEYSILFKVMETSENFFVFIQKQQVFLVDKSTVQGGTIEEVREVIKNALGKQYIICKY